MARLIVSIRDVSEAVLALVPGVDLLDVKEPALGSLGRAEPAILASILDRVAGQRPVSSALGELCDWNGTVPPEIQRLRFVKWGLASAPANWAEQLLGLRSAIESASACRVVYVCYADWRRAKAPQPANVVHQAILDRAAVVLFDTSIKDGTSLLDWLSIGELHEMASRLRASGVQLALAGGLGARDMRQLAVVGANWFATRGAVCSAGMRNGSIDPQRLQQIIDQLNPEASPEG